MWSVQPEVVLGSSTVEGGISAVTAAAAASATPALLGVLPMGADPDSLLFHSALLATAGQYLGTVSEHAAQRGAFAGAQAGAAAAYSATEALRAAAVGLGG